MTTAATLETLADSRPALIDVLAFRAWARAYLWWVGEYSLHEATDVLQHAAEQTGLVAELGQDAVQEIISDAFAQFFEAEL